VKPIPEFHQKGNISLENLAHFGLRPAIQGGDSRHLQGDIGLQVAADGRIWLCVDGIAFVRFSPHPNGRMSKDRADKLEQFP